MSTARLYVGNLSYSTTKETLEKVFAAHGHVVSVNLITERDTGRPKGFAFVEMSTAAEAEAAKAALNGTQVDGRTINVDNAREQEERRPGGFVGSRGGYGGGYGVAVVVAIAAATVAAAAVAAATAGVAALGAAALAGNTQLAAMARLTCDDRAPGQPAPFLLG